MVEPAVLVNVKPELPISWLEAFAPVVVVYPYKEFGVALEAVNYSIYGLQAGVFTHDLSKAFQAYEVLDVGGVILNVEKYLTFTQRHPHVSPRPHALRWSEGIRFRSRGRPLCHGGNDRAQALGLKPEIIAHHRACDFMLS